MSCYQLFREVEKKGKHLLSHRYNLLPLLCSQPGGVQRELIVKDLPGTKVRKRAVFRNENSFIFTRLIISYLSAEVMGGMANK